MTQWAFAIAEIGPLDFEPVALVLRVAALVADPPHGDQRRSWRRRALTALAVATVDIPEGQVDLLTGSDGRRRLGKTGLFASVAHRAGWVAAALGRVAIGIDVETDAEARHAADVILAGVDRNVDLAAWHGLAGVWAAREAVLKARGRDLTCDYRHWHFGTGRVRGDDEPALHVDIARRGGLVAAVAYVGD